MSRIPTTLANYMEYEGQNHVAHSTFKTKEINGKMANPVRPDLIKIYQKPSLDIVKEVNFITANGIITSKANNSKDITAQLITVPIATSSNAITMSPLKMEPTILPKTVHLSNSPVILSSPQRVVINNAHAPQHLLAPTDPGISWPGKRTHDFVDEYSESKRCKKGEKGGKGLRHFSMKVCEKVRKKGTTSYNEVADELVAEFSDPHRHMCPTDQAYDQKNIRRRVYDALNVLMAMNIISKEKKEIKWLGLPTNSAQEYQNLEKEKLRRLEKIKLKTQQLQTLILQQIAFKNLITRNKEAQRSIKIPMCEKIHLPFFLLSTNKETIIDCSISTDKKSYKFIFSDLFQMSEETDIMKRMGLVCNLDKGQSSLEEVNRAKSLVPKVLLPYINSMSQGRTDLPPGMIERRGIKIEGDYFCDITSECQEASSSSSGPGSECMDVENIGTTKPALSRQSSVGSLSDLPSRPGTSTPSDEFSDCDSDDMLDGEESN